MDAINLGPFAISAARLVVALSLAGLLIAAELLARRVDPVFSEWGWSTLWVALLGARAGYVLIHLGAYAGDPVSVLYIWQGGFSPLWGIVAGGVYSVAVFNHRRNLAKWLLIPVLTAGGVWLAFGLSHGGTPAQVKSLPSITLENLGGTRVNLTSFVGRPVVLNMWATWCPPCRAELPMLAQAAAEYPKVTFVFVDQGQAAYTVRKFLDSEKLAMQWPLLDPRTVVSSYYQVTGYPTTLFFNARGKLINEHLGELSRAALSDYLK